MPYTLGYFEGFYGRAEAIRYILQQSGAEYKDFLMKQEDWPNFKDKTPMGQLPVLKIDEERKLGQTMAIARYLAKTHGLAPKDDFDSARCDMIVGGIDDLTTAATPYFKARIGGDEAGAKVEWEKFKNEAMTNFLDRNQKFLADNGTGYLVGKQLTWADLMVAETLKRFTQCFDKDIMSGHPELCKFMERIHNLPKIKAHVANRPKCPF